MMTLVPAFAFAAGTDAAPALKAASELKATPDKDGTVKLTGAKNFYAVEEETAEEEATAETTETTETTYKVKGAALASNAVTVAGPVSYTHLQSHGSFTFGLQIFLVVAGSNSGYFSAFWLAGNDEVDFFNISIVA